MNVKIVFEELPEEFLATSRYVPKELDDVTIRIDLGKLFEEANRDEDAFIELFVRTDMHELLHPCLLYTSPSPRDGLLSRMPSSA